MSFMFFFESMLTIRAINYSQLICGAKIRDVFKKRNYTYFHKVR